MALTNYIDNTASLITKVEQKKAALGRRYLTYRNDGRDFTRLFEEINLISDVLEKVEDGSVSTADKKDFIQFLQKYSEIDKSPFPIPEKYR